MPEGRADFRNATTGLGSRGKSEKGPFQRDAGISETAQTMYLLIQPMQFIKSCSGHYWSLELFLLVSFLMNGLRWLKEEGMEKRQTKKPSPPLFPNIIIYDIV